MNKIEYLRHQIIEQYNAQEFKNAIETSDVLIREHWYNDNFSSVGFANDLYNQGCLYDEIGKTERAIELFSESAGQIFIIEGESRTFAKCLSRLGTCISRLGGKEPAYYIHAHVVDIYKRLVNKNTNVYANSLYNLANSAADSNRKKESLRYHLDALRIREKLAEHTGDITDVVDSYHSIAFMYESYKEYSRALVYAKAALTAAEEYEDLYFSASSYVADLYELDKKYEDALGIFDKLQARIISQVGNKHSMYLNISNRRTNLLMLLNRPEEALVCQEEICETFKDLIGSKHIFYANCLRNSGIIYALLKDNSKAEAKMLESIKIRREIDEITTEIFFLINLYIGSQDYEKALEVFVYALMKFEVGSKDFNKLVESLTSLFSNKFANDNEIINTLATITNKEKLTQIISKWISWESQ